MRKVDLVFSGDTTGSMFGTVSEVQEKVENNSRELHDKIPSLRLGAMLHKDYCNGEDALRSFDLTDIVNSFCGFVRKARAGGGCGPFACYELVLKKARDMKWRADAEKVLVLFGDEPPHKPSDPDNREKLDWKNEARMLAKMGVHVYAVQCLSNSYADYFYRGVAEMTGGVYLTLNQFSNVNDLIMAVAYGRADTEELERFEAIVVKAGRMNREMDQVFCVLLGRPEAKSRFANKKISLEAVPAWRFQTVMVNSDKPIKKLVEDRGLQFEKGRGFYEFTKTETIQPYKEIVLRDDESGDMWTGDEARKMLDIPVGSAAGNWRGKPKQLPNHTIFVQSTSVNRKLVAGTEFLYEMHKS